MENIKKILVINPHPIDLQELAIINGESRNNYSILGFSTYDSILGEIYCPGIGKLSDNFTPTDIVLKIINFCRKELINGVFSTQDYPGTLLASIVAHQYNLAGPSIDTIFLNQHKYHARVAQLKYVAAATPFFDILLHSNGQIKNSLSFPFFLKPIKSAFSVYAFKIMSEYQLKKIIKKSILPEAFIEQFNAFIAQYTTLPVIDAQFLQEQLLEGIQCTLEGYVYNNIITILGVVDSIMHKGTISFERFTYPSRLPEKIVQEMFAIATKLITGIQLNNTLFNIEFMYNSLTEKVHIIEINPRMSKQFADLFEKVNGVNTYQIALDLAMGQMPPPITKGAFACSASFVLRRFKNARVLRTPCAEAISRLHTLFSEMRFYPDISAGNYLSDAKQDGKSFRYALLHLGGDNWQHLEEKFNYCKQHLTFQFSTGE